MQRVATLYTHSRRATAMQRDRELELAANVQASKRKLLGLLTPSEQRTTRRMGSTESDTFEEKSMGLIASQSPRSGFLAEALKGYQAAVNALWTFEIQHGAPEKIAYSWRRKHLGYSWISAEDLQSEVIFLLREAVTKYDPVKANGATLSTLCHQSLHSDLTAWAGQQGPVELPRDSARDEGPDFYRAPMPDPEDERTAYDPWDMVNAYLDGEIDREDL